MKSKAKLRWDPARPVVANAREKLPQLARLFLAAGAAAASPDAPLKDVHKFRLLTKRLRYVLELFRPYYGPGLDQRIEALRALQDVLGRISDCATTEELIRERQDIPERRRAALIAGLQRTTETRLREFRGHWEQKFGTNAETEWAGYLERFARFRRPRS